MELAPSTVQCMPVRLRHVATVLSQSGPTTPEPTHRWAARKLGVAHAVAVALDIGSAPECPFAMGERAQGRQYTVELTLFEFGAVGEPEWTKGRAWPFSVPLEVAGRIKRTCRPAPTLRAPPGP